VVMGIEQHLVRLLSMITELGPCIFAQKGPRFGV